MARRARSFTGMRYDNYLCRIMGLLLEYQFICLKFMAEYDAAELKRGT